MPDVGKETQVQECQIIVLPSSSAALQVLLTRQWWNPDAAAMARSLSVILVNAMQQVSTRSSRSQW